MKKTLLILFYAMMWLLPSIAHAQWQNWNISQGYLQFTKKSATVNFPAWKDAGLDVPAQSVGVQLPTYINGNSLGDLYVFYDKTGTGTSIILHDFNMVQVFNQDIANNFYVRRYADVNYNVDGNDIASSLTIPVSASTGEHVVQLWVQKTGVQRGGPFFNEKTTSWRDQIYESFTIHPVEAKWTNVDDFKILCTSTPAVNLYSHFTDQTGVNFSLINQDNGTSYTLGNTLDPSQYPAGNYKVYAKKTYANGDFSDFVDIRITSTPVATITPDGSTDICEGTNLKLSAPVAPAGDTYTYQWSNGQTTREVNVNQGGTYTVTVSNGGCSTTSQTLVVTTKPKPGTNVSITGSTDLCDGLQTVLTLENAASFVWFKDGQPISGQTGQSLVVTTAGSYSATLTGQNGCTSTTTPVVITIKPNPKPTIAITGNTDFCDGGSVTLTAQSVGVPSNYTWSNGQTGQTIVVTTPGVYTVTATNPGGCQAVSTPVVVTVKPNPIPVITASGSANLCLGTSVGLSASQASSYLWNTGETTQTILVTTPGNYWVKVVNPSGCEATSAVTTVVVKPNPIATISANRSTALCAGETVTLNSSPGDSYVWSTGETTQSITVSQAGDYVVTVTKDGCSTVSAIKTVTVNTPITPTITPNGNLSPCYGEVVTLTASDAVSYQWSNGQTSKEIQVTQSGIYTVTTKDINGCSATSASVNVSYKAQFSPVISANGSTTICQGNQVTLTASNGVSYLWSNGATTQSIVATTPGNYTCVVTNAAGCSVETNPVNIVVLSRPTPVIAASGLTTFCAGSSVILTVSNPEAGATYFWSNGQSGQSITVSNSGTYTVNATYGNSCSAISLPTTITVLPIVKPTVTASGVLTFCDGGSVVLTINEVGDTYTWSDGVTGKTRTVTTSGTYIATITNSNGCSLSADPVTVTVNPKPKPTIAITGQSTFCNGSSATLNVSNPVSNATYTWSNGQTGNNIIVTTAGNYFVSATYQNGCSEISDPVAISVLPVVKPTVTASGSLSFCSGGTVTLTINETGDNYTWSDGVTGKTRNVTAPGNYIATITNANGCSLSSDPVVITVLPTPKPLISLSKPSPFCEGETTTAYITNPVTGANYTWSNGQSGTTATLSATGNYTVYATYANGCSTVSDPINIVVNAIPKPTISASNTTELCEGNSLTLTINETAAAYRWSNGATTKSIIVATAGSYIGYTSNNAGCERASDPVMVTVKDNKIASISIFGKTEFCEGETSILTASQGASWRWSNGETTRSITVSSTGIYSVEITNASGCVSNSADISIKVNPIPKPVIAISGATTICQGDNMTLTCSQVGTSYRWSNGETTKSITTGTAGSYTVYITNAQGCERASEPVEIFVKPNTKQVITASGATTFCQGESVTLSVPLIAGYNYAWSNGATGNSITVSTTGNYFVSITNALGCVSIADPMPVTVYPIPKPTIQIVGNTDLCEPETVTLTIKETGAAYRWSNGETTKSIILNSSQTVTAFIINAQGCERESDPVTITVKPNTLPVITASGNTTICEGESVILSVQNIAGQNYTWSNGQTGNSIVVTTPGDYYVKVRNAAGCERISAIKKVVVYPIPKPTIQIVGNTDLCEPETVTLTIKETGAAYRWSTGETTKSITVNSSQTVIGYIINAQGCERESDPVTITVKENPLPVIITSGSTTICEGESVTLSVPLVPGQNYTWSNGQTGNSIVVTTPGDYYVKVRNAAGCERISAIKKVVVYPIPKPTIQIVGNTDLCEPETVTLTIKETGAAYRWSTGEITKSITVNSSQTVIGYIINAQGCERESEPVTITVKPNPLPIVTKSGATTFCAGQSVTLSVPLVPGQNYKWSSGETTNSLVITTPGSYFITVTNANGCSRSSEVIPITVLANPKPVISLDKPAVICEDDIITLTASPAASYYWPGTGYTTQSIQVTKSGTYTVETINDLGCKNVSDPVTITVNKRDKAIIIASGVTTFCEGNSIVLKANPGQKGYLWSTGEITEQITVTKSGNYSVTITNQAGCTSVSESVPVKVLDKPKPTITPLSAIEFCAGGSVILKANEGKYFLWSNGEKSDQITVNKSGTFTVTITNDLGCSETSAPITVTVNEPTALTKIDDKQACINGGIVTLNSEFPKGGKYTGTAITENKFNPLVAGVGQHTITYTYVNANGCQSQINFVIEVTPLTDILPGQDLTVCENENPVLLAIPTVPAGTVITGTGVQSNKFYPTIAGIGTHVITYVFRNAYGCTSTAQRSITVTAVPDVVTVTGVMEGCNNDIIRLTANSNIKGGGALTFNWYKAGELTPFYTGRILDYKITQNESIFVSANSAGLISCASTPTEVKITSLNPTGDFVANATKIPLGGLVKFTSSTVGAVRYLWEFGDGGKSTDKDPVHYYYKAGSYTVTMYAYSQTGCPLVVKRSSYIVVDADPIVINPPGNETDPVIQDKGYTNTVIYPNPVRNGQAKLRIFNKENKSSDVLVEFYTVSGRLLSQTTYGALPGQNEIELKKLALLSASTYYLVRVQMNNQNFTFKILIL